MTKTLFDDWFPTGQDPAAYDPVAASRQAMKPSWPKRFYRQATAGEGPDGWRLLLDGRPAKTPGRRPFALPTRALGEAVAVEWDELGEVIDPLRMPVTRIVNSIIDGVAPDPGPVADDIVKYAGSDLICYRADGPDGLVARQAATWDPVLAWSREALGARFILSEGVMFVAQPDAAIAAIRAALPSDPWRIGAMHVATTLTGSALLALALERGHLTAEEAWLAAHVDEDFQISQWGADEEAAGRRAAREREMMAAAKVMACL
ncbi:ATP12 family chaperone protein [Phreatobacter sp.]|uniref:ATP12 family chaperone protein n=1 Tax=Phreatobacter sp. TaxID=1966341 RepID=UPI003F717864